MGTSVTSIAGILVIKRTAGSRSFSHLEVRIGHTNVTGHHTLAMGRISANKPCLLLGEVNGSGSGVFYCTRLMEGRYVTIQALKETIALDELNVIVRSGV